MSVNPRKAGFNRPDKDISAFEAMNLATGRAVKEQAIPLDRITVDEKDQVRVLGIRQDTVDTYAAVLRNGGELDPITVVRDEYGDYHMADGFHRYEAHVKEGLLEISAYVVDGGPLEVFDAAIRGNLNHGRPLTNDDKKYILHECLRRDHEWSKLSARELGRLMGVHHTTIGRWIDDYNSTGANPPVDRTETIGADGKLRDTTNIGTNQPEPKLTMGELKGLPAAVRDYLVSNNFEITTVHHDDPDQWEVEIQFEAVMDLTAMDKRDDAAEALRKLKNVFDVKTSRVRRLTYEDDKSRFGCLLNIFTGQPSSPVDSWRTSPQTEDTVDERGEVISTPVPEQPSKRDLSAIPDDIIFAFGLYNLEIEDYATTPDGNWWSIKASFFWSTPEYVDEFKSRCAKIKNRMNFFDVSFARADSEPGNTGRRSGWINVTIAEAVEDQPPPPLWGSEEDLPQGARFATIDKGGNVVAPKSGEEAVLMRTYAVEGPLVQIYDATSKLLEQRSLAILAEAEVQVRRELCDRIGMTIDHLFGLWSQLVPMDPDYVEDNCNLFDGLAETIKEFDNLLLTNLHEEFTLPVYSEDYVIDPDAPLDFVDDEDMQDIDDDVLSAIINAGFDIADYYQDGDGWQVRVTTVVENHHGLSPVTVMLKKRVVLNDLLPEMHVDIADAGKRALDKVEGFTNPAEIGALLAVQPKGNES